MSKKNDKKIQYQAGLVKYSGTKYDKSLKVSPKLAVISATALGIIITILNIFFK